MEPAAVASAVAREAGIHASQLYRWRQELCNPASAAPGFAAVTIAEPGVAPSPRVMPAGGLIGARVRIIGVADAAMVSAVMAALTGRRR
jgi:transposase